MSRSAIFALALMLAVSTAAFSNTAINGKHKDLKKDGKVVNCNYCHTDQKIEKKKKSSLSDDKKKLNGKSLSQVKSCAGKDCHK